MRKLEIACFNIQSAVIAQIAKADRIELCDQMKEGGTTPSLQMVDEALQLDAVVKFVMIRPRGGNFVYSQEEFKEMKNAIIQFKMKGVDGFVFGILTSDNQIDIERNTILVELAKPLLCTFHRAFDEVSNYSQAIEEIISCGFSTVLTSGIFSNVMDGKEVLKELHLLANNRITIMPGGGLRSTNISELDSYVNANYYHSSAIVDGGEVANEDEILKLKSYLK